tara:strand:+ start:832 stop:1056 length:225 start_codon:yes stop_codon:yes gene_type:complete
MSVKQSILKKFGEAVQRLRKKQGISQEALAHKIDVHRTYMGFIERGERNLTLMNIYKLSRALKVKIPDLFEFDQ